MQTQPLTEERVRAALELAGGKRGEAARLLNVDRVTLWRHMKRLGIRPAWSRSDREAA